MDEGETMSESPLGSLNVVVAAGCITVALLSALYVVKKEAAKR